MKTSDFYFDLPQELIAQDPLEDRSSSRLLVLDRESGKTQHRVFRDIIEYLNPGDCLVVNNTKVIPARLYGSKIGTDAKIEVLLLKRRENNVWETLVKPGKKCRVGARISFGEGLLIGEVIDVVDEGNRLIRLSMRGFLRKSWINWDRCRCRRTSITSSRTKTVIRRCMQSTMDLPQHRQPDCILHQNCWKKSKRKAFTLHM